MPGPCSPPKTKAATITSTITAAMIHDTLTHRGVPGSVLPASGRSTSSVSLIGPSSSSLTRLETYSKHSVAVKPSRLQRVTAYTSVVPQLWSETIEAHRRDVRQAILDTTAALVAEHGVLSVTMSQIAEETGIGRATLYKYFPDVESILFAWHEQQIASHLQQLEDVRDRAGSGRERLEAVLEAFALISHGARGHHDSELARFLGKDEHVAQAQRRVHGLLQTLVAEGARAGDVRDDVPSEELATYCLHALAAAASLPSKAAVRRLVNLTLSGMTSEAG